MLSPGNQQILVFKAENPNLDFEWDVTSFPEQIDKFEYLSNKKPACDSKEHSNFAPCNCAKNMIKVDKEKSMSPRKDKSKVSADVSKL